MLHKLTHPFETHTYLIIMLYVLRKNNQSRAEIYGWLLVPMSIRKSLAE